MRNLSKTALLCLLLLWMPTLWAADSGWLVSPQNDHAKVRIRAEPSVGNETRMLLTVQLEKGWKTYWRSPGEGGIAPTITWTPPLEAVKWYWPVPQRFDVSGISTQGYHEQAMIPIVIAGKVPSTLGGILTLSTCSNVCILTDYPFSLDLSSAVSAENQQQFEHDFAQAMGQVPIANALTKQIQAGFSQSEVQILAQRDEGWQRPELFFDTLEDVDLGKPIVAVHGNQLSVRVPATDGWGEGTADLRGKQLTMVITDGGLAQEATVTIGQALTLPQSTTTFWSWVFMALAGGLILNLMPCVLPVLAMKLSSILQTEHQTRRQVRWQFLASSAGIVTSFWLLALLMTALRLGNHALGWGIQFQNPWFIGFMVLVTALFTANLFGLFEIQLSSSLNSRIAAPRVEKPGLRGMAGHFGQGALATLLATPCSAPFLGTAVAFALAAPLPALWGIFTALGVGMSLPWLAVAAWPKLALCLPRPGRWMSHLRIAMGVLMLVSSLWLLSLMVSHVGLQTVMFIAGMLILALLLAIGWRYGIRIAAIVSLIGALVMGGLLLVGSLTADLWRKPLHDNIPWQPLTESAIKKALTEHKRVFVDVTADWCVTCKVNKIHVLMRDDVQQALQAPDVVALRGDWTRPSADITEFLRERGSVAIPFNQIYGPQQPQGTVLSPLLDRDVLLKVLADAKGNEK
ncbi:putative metal resistance protein [Yersinia frederiksenii]|uniref:Cytochrome C biogenesis transmembrane region family protein n=2 Tax=Yersinia frederiksenii TaxID=29484 RepID=A0ABR4W4X5_YERFR|nr:protein-disulfide reductase DsbD domain-containing protein [Yersinia frederiksenii]ATM95075.1 protein-disulfide reductase [Yersinia frederiksenii]EEQ14940.1 Membrane protein, suppressor for copper-sensitivity B [Yersinia frederiksenii ATCC 33641]KGA47590.1 cytochrome C biogenesis transmembrane region family protein [Yersinia frederiksenii ATCC 33641]SUP76374.1 putative metal resistance protein [Yersinia frederiksenii]